MHTCTTISQVVRENKPKWSAREREISMDARMFAVNDLQPM